MNTKNTNTAHATTTTGSIDYAHYDMIARQIRSQDAHRNIASIAKTVRAIAKAFRRVIKVQTAEKSWAPTRKPMRTFNLLRHSCVASSQDDVRKVMQ